VASKCEKQAKRKDRATRPEAFPRALTTPFPRVSFCVAAMKPANHRCRARKILLVDDHPIVRDGLAALIGHEPDLTVCGQTASAPEALEAADRFKPDLAIVDISIEGGNGLDLTRTLHERHPHLPVLILSMHDEEIYAERALRAGARGYVMKQESPQTVLQAVRKVLAGGVHVSEKIASRLLGNWVGSSQTPQPRLGVERLSNRELEVFELIGRGCTTARIAETLKRSVKTVESHRAGIKRKLGVKTAAELVYQAVQWVENANGRPHGRPLNACRTSAP